MSKIVSILLVCQLFLVPGSVMALDDQGLGSIMSIIDKAVEAFNISSTDKEVSEEDKKKKLDSASNTIVNLSRTLGKLSYSRLQCGQADVLAEFTQRVQKMPDSFRDPMRDAFQVGFDKSKAETDLLSEDECERLTQSRNLGDKEIEANVEEQPAVEEVVVEEEPEPEEDPKLKYLRIAELTGQLSFKRKFCGDNKVVTRDFNEVIGKMPEEFQAEAKQSYWKGYKHGKRLNTRLTKESCL